MADSEVQIANGDTVLIRTTTLTGDREQSDALLKALADQAGISTADINQQDVGPTWGKVISKKALTGLVLVLLAISLYISLRFEWKMALGAMIALVHDVVITAGVYALTGRQVTPATVIAILTILGFSLYDTVVIYDKIKENTETSAMVAKLGYAETVNYSLNQVLMRSVNTSLVVLLPILSLLFFGGETLKDFAFAMFVGVTTGAYSSIFIAAPGPGDPQGPRGAVPADGGAPSGAGDEGPAGPRRCRRHHGDRIRRRHGHGSGCCHQRGGRDPDHGPNRRARSRPRPKSKRKPPAKRKRR